jgi:protein involved in polysaccharide export with SLBB domain
MRIPRILLILATFIFLQGCIKYTPSREELEKDRGSDPSLTANLGSEEEFNAYERSLTDRLQRLITDRSYLLTASQSINGYAVGPGDLISVDVYGFGDLRAEAEVSPSGTLSLPLVGETDVKGRDVSSLKKHLTGLYSRYVRNPRIDVSIKNYHSNRVSVIGEVQRPGMYPLRRNGQLITELISEAGGKNQMASSRIILLPAPNLDYIAHTAHPSSTQSAPTDPGVGVEIDIEALL